MANEFFFCWMSFFLNSCSIMVLPPPCLFSGEQNIICRNDIISTCKKLLFAGVTLEFSVITNCPYANNQSKWRWWVENDIILILFYNDNFIVMGKIVIFIQFVFVFPNNFYSILVIFLFALALYTLVDFARLGNYECKRLE